VGTNYRFTKNSHTGTEALIMAAVLASGKTVLENAALEPEIDDLIEMLTTMGARIRRRYHRVIEIEGVPSLHGTIHRVMPDRNEAVSYAVAALATKGDIIVENAKREHLEAFLEKLEETGGGYEIGRYGIRFYYRGPLRATDVVTEPHPGFMTDWQPLWAVVLTQSVGTSIIHETVFPTRFQYLKDLQTMGAKASLFNPEVKYFDKTYNFNRHDDHPSFYHAAKITGLTPLKAGNFTVKDLRMGATLVLAAIAAKGTTTLHGTEHIDRGYEDLPGRLNSLGASIVRNRVH
jgi:UDP-N-acetylglucosamine 1-carboxyvinyltransferase